MSMFEFFHVVFSMIFNCLGFSCKPGSQPNGAVAGQKNATRQKKTDKRDKQNKHAEQKKRHWDNMKN